MKWEHELMRDMLERAREYEDAKTFECLKTAAMLKQAATVMNQWHRKMIVMEDSLNRIADCGWPGPSPEITSRADWMQQTAREALE